MYHVQNAVNVEQLRRLVEIQQQIAQLPKQFSRHDAVSQNPASSGFLYPSAVRRTSAPAVCAPADPELLWTDLRLRSQSLSSTSTSSSSSPTLKSPLCRALDPLGIGSEVLDTAVCPAAVTETIFFPAPAFDDIIPRDISRDCLSWCAK